MGLAQLQTVDIVTAEQDGGKGLHIIAGVGWSPELEALQYVQLLIKLTGVLAYASRAQADGQRCVVRVNSADEPPSSVLEFLRANDVQAFVGLDERPASGRPPRFPNLPDGQPDLDALQAANAADFAARHGLDGSMESLRRLDAVLEDCRREAGLGPDDASEDFEDGDVIVLAGAYAGEVLRSSYGRGSWVLGPDGPSGPVHLSVGPPENEVAVNVLGKVRKYLRNGSADSVHVLARAVSRHLAGE